MGKVLSGDYSGCSIIANKKSLRIDYVPVSTLLNKRNIVEHEVTSKVGHNTNVRVKYINNRYEKESVLQLTEKEFEILISTIEEQTDKPVVVKTKPVVHATT